MEQFYAYGFAHYGSGSWFEAADTSAFFARGARFEPRFWFALGATLQETRSYQDALHAWAMAALLKKDDPYPHFHAAECCFSLQMFADGNKALKEAALLIGEDENHILKDRIALLKQQWRCAV